MNSKNVKIKLFSDDKEKMLEERINKWLLENDVEVVDIKYQTYQSVYNCDCVSVMIIYKI